MPLSLSLSHTVSFEPVGKVTHVFFDDKNQQVNDNDMITSLRSFSFICH